jgi:pimeloyl-ACP methyl ester carboxylesterase
MTVLPALDAHDYFVDIPGGRLHLREWGSYRAPLVLFLHGFSGSAWVWDSIAQRLASDFRVLAVSQRGHGASTWARKYGVDLWVEDLATLARQLALPPFALVGLSMGGENAYAFAGGHPSALSHLVVVDIGPELLPEEGPSAPPPSAHPVFADIESLVDERAASQPRCGREDVRHRVVHNLREVDGGFTWRWDRALYKLTDPGWPLLERARAWELIEAVTAPTLVVHGNESDVLCADAAADLSRRFRRGSLVTVPGAGHMVPFEQPDLFVEALRRFLDSDANETF